MGLELQFLVHEGIAWHFTAGTGAGTVKAVAVSMVVKPEWTGTYTPRHAQPTCGRARVAGCGTAAAARSCAGTDWTVWIGAAWRLSAAGHLTVLLCM